MKKHTHDNNRGFTIIETLAALGLVISIGAVILNTLQTRNDVVEKIRLVSIGNFLYQTEIAKVRSFMALSDAKKPVFGRSATVEEIAEFLNFGYGGIQDFATANKFKIVSFGTYPTSTNSADGKFCVVEDITTHIKYDAKHPPYVDIPKASGGDDGFDYMRFMSISTL